MKLFASNWFLYLYQILNLVPDFINNLKWFLSLSNVYKNKIKSPFLVAIKADLELEDACPVDSVLEDAG